MATASPWPLIHGEREALTATARMTPARFFTGRRMAGVELRASDAQWSTGSGPEVSGPALSLVLTMTGRAAAPNDLSGDGLETLRSRF